jgi:hypothetical protein
LALRAQCNFVRSNLFEYIACNEEPNENQGNTNFKTDIHSSQHWIPSTAYRKNGEQNCLTSPKKKKHR